MDGGQASRIGLPPNLSGYVLKGPDGTPLVLQGFNGTVGWRHVLRLEESRIDKQSITSEALEALRIASDFYHEFTELYPRRERKPNEKVDGRDAYRIEVENSLGDLEDWYFDVQSGLMVRRDKLDWMEDGEPEEAEAYFDDYKPVPGGGRFLLPHSHTVIYPDRPEVNYVITLTEVKLNNPLPPASFSPR